jgi:hypothetical protein
MKRQVFSASVGILVFTLFSLLPNIVTASEPYNFISDVISSFQLCDIAGDRIKKAQGESFLVVMKSVNVYLDEIRAARGHIKPYLDSENENIKPTAKGYYEVYSLVIANNEDLLGYIETILNNPNDNLSKEGTVLRKFSEYLAADEQLWRSLLQVTAMSTYTLVDMNKTEGGKLCCLSITNQERKNLVNQIEQAFGPKVKGGPKGGQYPLEGSASLLWYFLNQGWKPSDQK